MAKGRIEKGDIVAEGILKDFNKDLKTATDNVNLLTTALKAVQETGKALKKGVSTVKPKDVKTIQEFNTLTAQSNQNAKNRSQIDKTLLVEKEKIAKITREQNKAIKVEVALGDKQINTLEKLRARNAAIKIAKDKVNFSTKKGQDAIRKLNAELDKNNAVLQKNASALGKQKMNIGNYKSAISGLRSGLAQLGLSMGVFQMLKGAFTTVRDFQQGTADLASVLGEVKDASGKWSDGMTVLIDQQKKLGASTTFTATQVAELQTEYAKLGFTQKEIENVTEATLSLAEATGVELADAASVTGGVLNAFGKTSEETQQVVDTMAKAFSTSSLDMEKFKNGMSAVAPVAKVAGVSLERTTAMLGTLTDNNIVASKAGNGLKNVYLALSKHGITYEQAMQKINGATDKNAASMSLFGKEGATVGVILAQQGDKIQEQTELLNKNTIASLLGESAAQKMADTQRDTLGGSIKLLSSAWDGIILKFENGVGVFGQLKNGISFLADNLETITKVIVTLGTAFGVYYAIDKTTKAFKALNLVMKANPIMLMVAAISAIVVAIKLWTEELSIAEQVQKTLLEVSEDAARSTAKEKSELAALLSVAQDKNISDEQRIQAIQRLNEISPEMLGNITLENVNTEATTTAIGNYVAALDKKSLAQAIASKRTALHIKLLDAEATSVEDNIAWYDRWSAALADATGDETALKFIDDKSNEIRAETVKGIEAEIAALDALLKEKIKAGDVDAEDIVTPTSTPTPTPTSTPTVSKEISLLRQTEDVRIKLLEDGVAKDKIARQKVFDRLVEDTKKKKTNDVEYAAWKVEQDLLLARDLKKIDDDFAKEKQDARDKTSKKILEDLDKHFDAGLKRNVQEAELNILNSDALEGSKEMLKLLEAQILAKAELAKIGKTDIEKQIIDARAIKDIQNLHKKEVVDTKKKEDEIAKLKEDAIDLTTQYFIEQADKRIAKIDEEIDAATKQADLYRTLAENGNITAKESLAEQNRLIAEANLQKEKEEKRKAQILMVANVLKAFNTELQVEGTTSGEAFMRAVTSTTLLTQFIGAMPTYLEGTEDTGTNGRGIDGKGGFNAVLHPNERVMTKEQNAMIGSVSNDYVAQVMEQHRVGNYMDGGLLIAKLDNAEIVNGLSSLQSEMKDVKKAILNQPRESNNTAEMLSNYMMFENKQTQGGKTTTSRFKVKK